MDTKSANRIAWAHSEGIYEAVKQAGGGQRLRCILCGKEIGTNAVVRAAHGKKHVREGTAKTRTEYGYDGPRTVYEPVVNTEANSYGVRCLTCGEWETACKCEV